MNVLIAVIGATGKQGSSVIEAARDWSHRFAIRAIVRDAGTPKAAALGGHVSELVEADVDDLESLRNAFEGADAAYCVTPPDGDCELGRETVRARNMAVAARDVGLKHVVWSTQEDTRPLLEAAHSRIPTVGGRFRVPSYDAKGEADAAFRELGVPTTFMRTSFYWESLFRFGVGPSRSPDGGAVIRWPLGTAKLPGIAVADIGRCAVGVFAQSSAYVNRTIGICGEELTGLEIAAALAEVLHIGCAYEAIEPAAFRRLPFLAAARIGAMFEYKRDLEHLHRGYRDVALSRSLNPRLMTFREWLTEDHAVTALRRLLGEPSSRRLE